MSDRQQKAIAPFQTSEKVGDRSNNISSNSNCRLSKKHLEDLQSSGLTLEQIKATGHFSADRATTQKLMGCNLPGLIFQYCDPFGKPYTLSNGKPFYRIKPDWGDLKTEDSSKYLSAKGNGCRPYFSRLYSNWEKAVKSTKIDLWETEGEKKADCGCSHGLAVIAFSGVDSWQDKSPRKPDEKVEKSRILPELEVVTWQGRKVYQCFDSDIIEKLGVQSALAKRANVLQQKGAFPFIVLLPNELDGSKNGLDDFVVRHGEDALQELARIAQPTPVKVLKVQDKDEEESQNCTLKLEEPNENAKAVMAWAVLKESWAYRPSIGWYKWQGKYWELQPNEVFEATLNQFMDAQNWQKRSSNVMTSVTRLLRSKLLVVDEAWNPFGKLAFMNGTLDLTSGAFTPNHNPGDRITRLRPYAFDPQAQCPTWLKFISEAMEGDEERIKLIQAIFRYSVFPRPKDRKAEIEKSFDFFGQKGTGKGTTLDVLTNLVGIDNIGSARADTFKTPEGLGQLIDKDLAVDHDASGFLSDVGNYNKVVSNEPVVVKKLYKDSYTTRLGVVVIRAYNAFISVPDGSEGLDRRITVIPFNHQPKVVDTNLSQKLAEELSGIFAWCYSLSAEEMKHTILNAGKIQKISEASIERFEANNPEYRFLLENYPNGEVRIQAGILFKEYQEWCRENGHQPKSQVKFKPAIESLKCVRSASKSNGCYSYSIPKMKDFDVEQHLGIVKGQLEDSLKDSSNPDIEGDRDSCRQLDEKNSEVSKASKIDLENTNQSSEEALSVELSTTIPIPFPESNTTVSQSFETVSELSTTDSSITQAVKVGDRVLARKKDNEKFFPATVDSIPDPKQGKNFWKVLFDGQEQSFLIWESKDMRLLNGD